MRRLYVKLTKEELERLLRLAEAHRRHPSAEAAVLLARALCSGAVHPTTEREVPPCQS